MLPVHQLSMTARRFAVIEINDSRWAAFVADHPHATAFHQPAWAAMLADCYRFRAGVAVSMDATGAIVAGMPLLQVGLRRRRWVSLSFTDRCSPLAVNSASRAEFGHQLERARLELGLRSIEIRDNLEPIGWPIDEGHVHELELTTGLDAIFACFHSSRVKNAIRRAEKEGISVRREQSREGLVKGFYRLHVETRRRLGVPVQSRRFFDLLWERMLARGFGFVLTAELHGTPIASAVFLTASGRVTYKFSASDRRYRNLGGTNALLWKAIQESAGHGARVFDFGRTETGNEGLRAFKLGWGAREQPLRYTVLGSAPPSGRLGAAGELLKPLIRRSPIAVGRMIGALAYRYTA
jgi:CelD/BcsL family acetyltransferase involved in cellulose biosynthesis